MSLHTDPDLVERVARSLARSSPPMMDLQWPDLPKSERQPYEDAAIVVLMDLNGTLARSALSPESNPETTR